MRRVRGLTRDRVATGAGVMDLSRRTVLTGSAALAVMPRVPTSPWRYVNTTRRDHDNVIEVLFQHARTGDRRAVWALIGGDRTLIPRMRAMAEAVARRWR